MRVAVSFETEFVIDQMPQVKEEPGKNKGFPPSGREDTWARNRKK